MSNRILTDKDFMLRAIRIAKKAEGKTNPNPLVGAVIVKNNKIIAEGFHQKYGDLHAERNALKNCISKGLSPEGSTMYVTLEPCCHFGKQPPCTQAIIDSKISKVIVGSQDPNPLVHGKGISFLKEHGIKVQEDFLKDECDKLNPIFFHYITKKMPYVALKYAMTLDGKIATKTGSSQWITNEKSRKFVHKLRNRYSSILVGIGTVLKDNPNLNCRLPNGSNPTRIICDSNLNIPIESNIVKTAKEIPTIVVCSKENSKKQILENMGIEVLCISDTNTIDSEDYNKINLNKLMKILAEKKIDSVLIEGGAEINYNALKSGIVNHIYAFVGSKVFGGNAKTPFCGEGIKEVSESFSFHLEKTTKIYDDILLEYNIEIK